MRQGKFILPAAGLLAIAAACAGPVGAQERSGERSDGCRVIHKGDDSSGNADSSTAGTRIENGTNNALESHVTVGGGRASGGTTSSSSSSGVSTGVTAGGGKVTTTTSRNGKGVSVQSSGDGSSSAAAASSSGNGSMAAGTSGDDCVIVTD